MALTTNNIDKNYRFDMLKQNRAELEGLRGKSLLRSNIVTGGFKTIDAARKELERYGINIVEDQDALTQLGNEEEARRQQLGQQQQKQILDFAGEQENRAKDYRSQLASSLAQQGQSFFNQVNPSILEDLNSRGLFTSQTARDKAQSDALKEIELNNQQQLLNFDTKSFDDINDIRSGALSTLLGGDQAGLDAALELRRAGFQRAFEDADAAKNMAFANMLSKRQSRDQLMSSLIGVFGKVGASAMGG